MKIKNTTGAPATKATAMDRIQDELFRLGFCGGELNAGPSRVKAKREFYFCTRQHSPLKSVVQFKGKGKKREPVGLSVMRSKTFTEVGVNLVLTSKDGSIKWNYDSSAQEKLAKGSTALHSKLVKVLGELS